MFLWEDRVLDGLVKGVERENLKWGVARESPRKDTAPELLGEIATLE